MRTRDKNTIRRIVSEHGAKAVHEIVDSVIVIAAPHDHLSALGLEYLCSKAKEGCGECPAKQICKVKDSEEIKPTQFTDNCYYTVDQIKKAHNIK